MLIFDIETDGLDIKDITTIHTMTIYNTIDQKFYIFDRGEVPKGILMLHGNHVCGHNIIAYDLPAINKFYKCIPDTVYDTLVVSRVLFNNIKDIDQDFVKRGILEPGNLGSHSLEAWGQRLGVAKGTYNDWETWTPEMSLYCKQDVEVTKALVLEIEKYRGVMDDAIDLEMKVSKILQRQKEYGFLFDTEGAYTLYNELLTEQEDIMNKLRAAFPTREKVVGIYKRDNKKRGIKAGDPKLKEEVFNPSSESMIAERLTEKYGWKPKNLTASGSPKLDKSVMSRLKYPEVKLINRYRKLSKFSGYLGNGNNAWLKLVGPDNRLHGSVISVGAVTHRMAHSSPNLAQIPARDSLGSRIRGLFVVPPGKKLVGCDASGLELRCLAHYLGAYDSGEYTKQILEGDIHTYNQRAAGLDTRDQAKTFIYALIYGASDKLLGSIAKGKKGSQLRESFYKGIPALEHLTESVKSKAKYKPLRGLDGRYFYIRSIHSALNMLLQGAGAIVMKRALVILDASLRGAGYEPGKDFEFVANVHDEFQIEVSEEFAEDIGNMATQAIEEAGEYYHMRCPMAGEYKIGNSWKETH